MLWEVTGRKQWDRMGRGRTPQIGAPQSQDEEGTMNAQDGRGHRLDDFRCPARNIRREPEERHCGYQGFEQRLGVREPEF